MILAFIIPFFVWIYRYTSPLGTSIEVTFVYADNTPIVGLTVELYDGVGFHMEADTNADGIVLFAGLKDETYTWKWSWQGMADSDDHLITCDKIVWEFTETLDYWTLEKQFYYKETPTPPTKELDVTLVYPDLTTVTKTTLAGFVSFGDLKAGDYTLEWVWGGISDSEAQSILFPTPTPVVMTNFLEPKSGEAYLYLAEEFGR